METTAAQQVYLFFWHALTWSVAVAAFPVVTCPWGPVAYKIWFGNKEIDEELHEEMWTRCIWASVGLFILALIVPPLDYFTCDIVDIPAAVGPIHVVYLAVFVSLVAFAMMHCFALEDFFQGLSLTIMYLYIPVALFALAYWLIKWNPLADYVYSWLARPK